MKRACIRLSTALIATSLLTVSLSSGATALSDSSAPPEKSSGVVEVLDGQPADGGSAALEPASRPRTTPL